MTDRKKLPKTLNMPFSEALARLLRTRPEEVEASIASDIVADTEADKAHKRRVEKALEDGARPRKGRFRL